MKIETLNPFDDSKVGTFEIDDEEKVKDAFETMRKNQKTWKKDLDERIEYVKNVIIKNLENEKKSLSELMSMEMGKPITQSISEVEKTIRTAKYFVEHARKFLADDIIPTEAYRSYVKIEPLGVIYLIMPWNFPLWQVSRAAIPAMLAGNTIVLKHASIVTGTSKKIEEIFGKDYFRSIIVSGKDSLQYIKYSNGVSFTGSENAGSQIAAEAGRNLKKTVLELGGSDPFIVLDDADIENAAKNSTFGRLQNNGQSCIASKRFIVSEKIFHEFYEAMKENFSNVKIGNQMDEKTFIGPLSSDNQRDIIKSQIEFLSKNSQVFRAGEDKGNIVSPTIINYEGVYNEEVFGPVAIIKKFKTLEEAAKISNETKFGLGASIWGSYEQAEKLIPQIESGMVFVNSVVASDPRLPFGGVKNSGYGKELSKYGILEFTNIKTIWAQKQ
ncbi:aldehyde dehydrogenase family protein [Caldiplasma sukawensis]